MKTNHFRRLFILGVTSAVITGLPSGFAKKRAKMPDVILSLPAQIQQFIVSKEQQLKSVATARKVEIPPEVSQYFEAAKKGEWPAAEDLFGELRNSFSYQQGSADEEHFRATAMAAALEVELALEAFADGESKCLEAYGRDILRSMPAGSIYFGGDDPGRGLPTAYCKSHADADPVFVLTQNALADGRYLTYLRDMYGAKIRMLTDSDSKKAFEAYTADAKRRLQHDEKFSKEPRQIKAGENVTMLDGKISVSGQVAVMAINGLLAKDIFDRNPGKDFYVEESFPLDWMYPHLSPHGLILKINRQPVPQLTGEVVQKDQKYWSDLEAKLIGDWLKPETSIPEICAFARRVFGEKDLQGFKGDAQFVTNLYSVKSYSKLRSSIGGVYAWRALNTKSPADKEKMVKAADFAFRQAFALYPGNSEAVFRYSNLLIEQKRLDDALQIVEAASQINPAGRSFSTLIDQIEGLKSQAKP